MFFIGKILVSSEIVTCRFSCDINECKGMCCCEGEAGAPLEYSEIEILTKNIPVIKNYLKKSSVDKINRDGCFVKNLWGGFETPIADNGWCIYAVEENGIVLCGIEMAWKNKQIDFRKPVSCHLYPIRIRKFGIFEGLIYERWDVCRCKTLQESPFLIEFASEALERKYGNTFVEKLREISMKENT
ncbi:MAG TPA: DUF3109 family protein [bacterium]|nr:DUF3109 family protein [bacterium]HOL49401.1 DUF3109 family protein [bacterium]HPO52332.1 DUF3109 family protein [bacterium]